jgi:hypothetical protein
MTDPFEDENCTYVVINDEGRVCAHDLSSQGPEVT